MAVWQRPYAQAPSATTSPAAGAAVPLSLPPVRRRWLIAAGLVTAIMAVLPVVQASGAAQAGVRVQELQRERQDLSARVHQQEATIAGLSALPRIERDARRLGLEPGQSVTYLAVPVEAPEGPRLPSRFKPAPSEDAPKTLPTLQRILRSLLLP